MLKIIAGLNPLTIKYSPIIYEQNWIIKALITNENSPSVMIVMGIDKICMTGLIKVLMSPSTSETKTATHHGFMVTLSMRLAVMIIAVVDSISLAIM